MESNLEKDKNCLLRKLKFVKIPFDLIVNGTSMYPFLNNGEKVRVEPIANYQDIHINDVIVYYKFPQHLTVHRVIDMEINANNILYIKTKGDNNKYADKYYVEFKDIIGKAIKYNK